jgi:hypothetical protein
MTKEKRTKKRSMRSCKEWNAQIALLKAKVKLQELKTAGDEAWEAVKTGSEKVWDEVKTALDILTVDNDALQFYLDMGLAYVNVNGERGNTLQMDTPLSSIRVYERAKFSVDVSNDDDTDKRTSAINLDGIIFSNKEAI